MATIKSEPVPCICCCPSFRAFLPEADGSRKGYRRAQVTIESNITATELYDCFTPVGSSTTFDVNYTYILEYSSNCQIICVEAYGKNNYTGSFSGGYCLSGSVISTVDISNCTEQYFYKSEYGQEFCGDDVEISGSRPFTIPLIPSDPPADANIVSKNKYIRTVTPVGSESLCRDEDGNPIGTIEKEYTTYTGSTVTTVELLDEV